jgi:hypothetical protein
LPFLKKKAEHINSIFYHKKLFKQNVNHNHHHFWHNFQSTIGKYVIMEMRKESTEKRRRKIVHRGAELVRSVKPGQASVQAWEKETTRSFDFSKVYPAA